MKSLTVFLDASVILSGLASSTGGSRKILESGASQKLRLVTSELVIKETSRHLSKLRIAPYNLEETITSQTIKIIPAPSADLISKFQPYTKDPDDAHVIAAAAISGADTLITLDQKHLLTPKVKSVLRPIKVFSPKQFLDYLHSLVFASP